MVLGKHVELEFLITLWRVMYHDNLYVKLQFLINMSS